MKINWKFNLTIISIIVIVIVLLVIIPTFHSSKNSSSETSSAIDLSSSDQSFIMMQINDLNYSGDPNSPNFIGNKNQYTEASTGVQSASEITFLNGDCDPDENADLVNFLNNIGGGTGGALYGFPTLCGIPLTYNMIYSQTSPSSTPYKLSVTVGVELDQQSLYKINKLLQNKNLIKKYAPYLHFGFITNYSNPTSYALNTAIITNQKPLIFDVNLYRQDANGDWDNFDIATDPSNHLIPINNNDGSGS